MKLKLLSTFFFCCSLVLVANAQWVRTHVSTFNAESVYGITAHNGALYGAINSKGLIKWNPSTSAWDSLSATGLTFNGNSIHIGMVKSSGNALYAFVNHQLCASTMVFKSIDNGQSFVPDTAGLPTFSCDNRPLSIYDAFVLDGRVIVIMNTGNYSKMPGDAAWVKNAQSATVFSENWASYNGSWYAWGGSKLQKSVDQGQTWTQPTNTNLPSSFDANLLHVNTETGRIYIAGSRITTGLYKMLYSDDEGATWDSIPIHQALGSNWIGQRQAVLGMFSKGDFMELMLTNNANNSHPDLIVSTDGGQTFQIDTVGLQANAFGTVTVRAMVFFNNELFMAPNYFDVYRKGGIASTVAAKAMAQVKVYPNPVEDVLNITSSERLKAIRIVDLQGREVARFDPSHDLQQLNLGFLQSGGYLLKAVTDQGEINLRVIKK